MPLDTTDIQTVLRTFRQAAASPPNSVTTEAIRMHEILGGTADPDRSAGVGGLSLEASGYFKTWKAGSITVNPSAPAAGKAGTVAAPPPAVTILDARGGPVDGFPVRFRVTEGGGTLKVKETVVTVLTDKRGVASVDWTFGPVKGDNEVVAEGYQIITKFRVTST